MGPQVNRTGIDERTSPNLLVYVWLRSSTCCITHFHSPHSLQVPNNYESQLLFPLRVAPLCQWRRAPQTLAVAWEFCHGHSAEAICLTQRHRVRASSGKLRSFLTAHLSSVPGGTFGSGTFAFEAIARTRALALEVRLEDLWGEPGTLS